jgi:hypothetical protein
LSGDTLALHLIFAEFAAGLQMMAVELDIQEVLESIL